MSDPEMSGKDRFSHEECHCRPKVESAVFCPYCGEEIDGDDHRIDAGIPEVFCANTVMSSPRYCMGCSAEVEEYDLRADGSPKAMTDGGQPSAGVEQLPEKWRRRAEKAQEAGYTEKAIAVLDCADELEERLEDDGLRADGGPEQTDTDRCPWCQGSGKKAGGGHCYACDGTGERSIDTVSAQSGGDGE